jgi:hypothetical protein
MAGTVGLAGFLGAAAARGFAWGTHDCMLFAADWALALTGRDPAAAWRGTYSDEAGAVEIVRHAGGRVPLMQDGLEGCGWTRLHSEPTEGDIVLASLRAQNEAVAGIVTASGRTAILMRDGLIVGRLPALWAWRHG